MKSTGIIRKVDELGRIVLPKELRTILKIHERDSLEIYVKGNYIVLQKYEPEGAADESEALSTGIVRRVDELGRIVLPKELRTMLCVAEKDPLEIYVDGGRILLQKYEPSCVFCGGSNDTIQYRERTVCGACLAELARRADRERSRA